MTARPPLFANTTRRSWTFGRARSVMFSQGSGLFERLEDRVGRPAASRFGMGHSRSVPTAPGYFFIFRAVGPSRRVDELLVDILAEAAK